MRSLAETLRMPILMAFFRRFNEPAEFSLRNLNPFLIRFLQSIPVDFRVALDAPGTPRLSLHGPGERLGWAAFRRDPPLREMIQILLKKDQVMDADRPKRDKETLGSVATVRITHFRFASHAPRT